MNALIKKVLKLRKNVRSFTSSKFHLEAGFKSGLTN